MPTVSAQPQQMQQAHAIHYVTKIRNRFSAEPETYRLGLSPSPYLLLLYRILYMYVCMYVCAAGPF
jgi:hypothetical protein